jgi:hypothetical protein
MVISFPGQILYGERYQSIFFLGGIEKNSPSTIAKREVKGTNQIVIKPSVLDIPFRNKFHWAFEYVRIVEHSPTGRDNLSVYFSLKEIWRQDASCVAHDNGPFWNEIPIVVIVFH